MNIWWDFTLWWQQMNYETLHIIHDRKNCCTFNTALVTRVNCIQIAWGSRRVPSAKFTPAVVMSAGSVSNIPAQKLQPGLCVNLCIQVLCVKSFHTTRPNSGSAGKLWCFIQNLSCSIIHPSFFSLSLQCFLPLFELLFPLQMKLFLFWLFVTLPNSSSCVLAGGIFSKSHLTSYIIKNR